MGCQICEKRCEKRMKVFVKGDELFLCHACVVRLRTRRLEYCEERERYRFGGIRRKNGLLRGRISRDHRLLKGKAGTGNQVLSGQAVLVRYHKFGTGSKMSDI